MAELESQHADAQADCKDGIKSQCGNAASLLRRLTPARAALQKCLREPRPADKPPVNSPPVDPPPVVTPPVNQPLQRCAAQRERIQDLEGQHAEAKEDCKQGIKGQCGRAGSLARQLVTARAALQRCLDQPVQFGTVFPNYLVVTLIYSPPGIGSEASYDAGSTTGITTDVTHSFKAGMDLSASGDVLGTGVEVSFGMKGGVKSGHSFEIKKATTSGLGLESEEDDVDHARDVFFIWTNVRVDIGQRSDGRLTVGLGLAGDGQVMDIVPLTVAQLRDPSLIPEPKKARLINLTADDFRKILALHPLAASDDVDLGRLRFIKTLQVSGPDHPGDSIPLVSETLTDEKATGIISGASQELSVGLKLKTGFNLLGALKTEIAAGLTWEWGYETSSNVTQGQTEEASLTLRSSTVEYFEVIDVYQDTMFKTFAFVSHAGRLPKESAAISGVVMDQASQPVPNQRVDVIKDNGEVQTTVTNAQGVYRIFGVSEGSLRIEVADVAQEVTIVPDRPMELSFQI